MWKRTGNVREEEFDRENKRRGEYETAERQTMRERWSTTGIVN